MRKGAMMVCVGWVVASAPLWKLHDTCTAACRLHRVLMIALWLLQGGIFPNDSDLDIGMSVTEFINLHEMREHGASMHRAACD